MKLEGMKVLHERVEATCRNCGGAFEAERFP
jgi:hypothetical protein